MGKYTEHEPETCWVGDRQKICYPDRENAELAARLVEHEHGLAPYSLYAYHCDFGEHWHLASKKDGQA